jgi:hypothetical protein
MHQTGGLRPIHPTTGRTPPWKPEINLRGNKSLILIPVKTHQTGGLQLVSDRISINHMSFISCYPDSVDQRELLRIDVSPADTPAFLEHNGEERFYIRTGPGTAFLKTSELYDYLRKRFYRITP